MCNKTAFFDIYIVKGVLCQSHYAHNAQNFLTSHRIYGIIFLAEEPRGTENLK